MKLLVIDVETTCNDNPSYPRQDVELIEIGCVSCEIKNHELRVIGKFNEMIKPTINPLLTPFCKKLLNLEQADVERAETIDVVLDRFQVWLNGFDPNAWCSWGKFDKTQFSVECETKKLNNPLGELHHENLKQIFARKRGHRVGMKMALQLTGLELQGKHHSGLDDAKNIAQIVKHDALILSALAERIKTKI